LMTGSLMPSSSVKSQMGDHCPYFRLRYSNAAR
jgi:hypothetical protein